MTTLSGKTKTEVEKLEAEEALLKRKLTELGETLEAEIMRASTILGNLVGTWNNAMVVINTAESLRSREVILAMEEARLTAASLITLENEKSEHLKNLGQAGRNLTDGLNVFNQKLARGKITEKALALEEFETLVKSFRERIQAIINKQKERHRLIKKLLEAS